MKFSQVFKINREPDDDWFDPLLTRDTDLFIDPFLLYDYKRKHFDGAYDDVLDYFNIVFTLVIKSKGIPISPHYQLAVWLLSLGESSGLCLGYTWEGINGSGIGKGLASGIADSMWKLYFHGLKRLTNLEQINFLQKGIGPDRMSDTIANIIRLRLVAYTREVCKRHNIHMQRQTYRYCKFNSTNLRWEPCVVRVPINPFNNQPILLTPEITLRPLPTITPQIYWRYCWNNRGIFKEADFEKAKKFEKVEKITEIAQNYPTICEKYVFNFRSNEDKDSYDFDLDPKNIDTGYFASESFINNNRYLIKVSSYPELQEFLENSINLFKQYVEYEGGRHHLWGNANNAFSEQSTQSLFYGFLKHYCATQKVTFSPEYETGRKPLLFCTNDLASLRFWMRVKLARNLLNGPSPKKRLVKEANQYDYEKGIYIAILLTAKDDAKVDKFRDILHESKAELSTDISFTTINGQFRDN